MKINKTQLSPEAIFERHVFHRDQFAHYLRWSFVLNQCKFNKEKILDLGCGTGSLAEVLYRNRFKPVYYHGVDIRKKTIESNKLKKFNFEVDWSCVNMIIDNMSFLKDDYTKICCFEVVEHFEQEYLEKFLLKVKELMNENTLFYLSTPCFNGKKAQNHIQEYTYAQMKEMLSKHFTIKEHYGTFASKKDVLEVMYEGERSLYEELSNYYDSNLLSVIFAPLHPEKSRNCVWVLKK